MRAAAERHLGDGALHSQRFGALAVPDAEARGPSARSSSASARGISIRRDVGFRVAAAGDTSCKTGETMFTEADSHGKAINGNSVMGHSLEADKGQDMRITRTA